LWNITSCIPLKVSRRFGGTFRLHFQDRIIILAINWRESMWKAEQVGSSLDLFFNPEDGGDMFPLNVGLLAADYTALYPRR
jgi:hypothetical protein